MATDRRCLGCSHDPHQPYGCRGHALFISGRCGCDYDVTQTYLPMSVVAA